MTSRAIPIIRLQEFLIVSVQTELSDELVHLLKDDIAAEIARLGPSGLVLELSGIDVFDSYIAASVRDLAQLARLMGVRTVVAGLDPGMAITLVEMGMSMAGVETALNLDSALEVLQAAVVRRKAFERDLMSLMLGDAAGTEGSA